MKRKQLSLFASAGGKTEHGGEARKDKRKVARPIATRKPMHLVLRSSKAVGDMSFRRRNHREMISQLLSSLAKHYGIRILGFENVGNHLHLLIQGKSRVLLQSFLRTFPAKIALAITGAKKGNPKGRFFDSILFSRVITWGRDLVGTKDYLFKNQLEGEGVSPDVIARWREFEKLAMQPATAPE